jgi:hypothetical protein
MEKGTLMMPLSSVLAVNRVACWAFVSGKATRIAEIVNTRIIAIVEISDLLLMSIIVFIFLVFKRSV